MHTYTSLSLSVCRLPGPVAPSAADLELILVATMQVGWIGLGVTNDVTISMNDADIWATFPTAGVYQAYDMKGLGRVVRGERRWQTHARAQRQRPTPSPCSIHTACGTERESAFRSLCVCAYGSSLIAWALAAPVSHTHTHAHTVQVAAVCLTLCVRPAVQVPSLDTAVGGTYDLRNATVEHVGGVLKVRFYRRADTGDAQGDLAINLAVRRDVIGVHVRACMRVCISLSMCMCA
jgi:hypothetical protein